MPFCATCGSPVEGRFCAKCGSPVAAGSPPPPPAGGPAYVPPQAQPMTQAAPMADNVASALAYIFIVNIIFLVIAPYNRNPVVRFHSFQSLFLDVACIVFWVGLGIVMNIMVGIGGFFTFWWLYMLVRLAIFIGWLFLVLQTYNGKTIVLPVIGPLAQQQA